MTEAVEYVVSLEDRNAHLYRLEGRFPVARAFVDLKLPVWTPGSYLVREYQRHVQDVAAHAPDGRALPVTKLDKATWRVDAREADGVVVTWRVYAYDLTVRSAHLDDTHAYWNGACLFLYHPPDAARPHRVRVEAPPGWHVTTALDRDGGAFVAANHDELVDSPFEVGTHEVVSFTAQNRPHRLAIWGRLDHSRQALVEDITKIIDVQADLFGGVPYPHYTFILLLAPNAYGGLEHLRSCSLLASPFTFHPRKKYEEFLELVSHEFFHLWNVKRIHPEALGPFDYQREAYTRSLWVMEGLTSYYDRLFLVRAGLQQPKRYLEKLGEELGKIAGTPGRLRQSLEESSFDAWIKLYRPDENSQNSTISYYLKGGVVCLLLDVAIRERSGGRRSLDDVVRLLWERHGRTGVGFADASVQALFEEGAGVPLGDLFDAYVRGREELDAGAILRAVGLEVRPRAEEEEADGKGPAAWLGATLKDDGEVVKVTCALAGGPAEAAGLYAHDEIVALDGWRVDHEGLKDRLAAKRPGEVVTLTLFRRDELRTVEVTLGARPPEKLEVLPVAEPTDAQRAHYEAWLGQALPAREGEEK